MNKLWVCTVCCGVLLSSGCRKVTQQRVSEIKNGQSKLWFAPIKGNPLIGPALEHSWYLCIYSLSIALKFLAFGFYYEGYTVALWRRVIRRSYLQREAHSFPEPVFRDRRDAWKHPWVFGLFGDPTGATGQKTRRASAT